VIRAGVELNLTATELRLLLEFAAHPGQVLSRQVLLKRVWDYGYVGDSRIVDAAVARLRAKVEPDPANPALLRTVRGMGYRLVKP
jgi:DNA-binding response OmpR family regulator